MKKHIIWDGNLEACEEQAFENWKIHREELGENVDDVVPEDVMPELYSEGMVALESEMWHDDEMLNLSKEVDGDIIAIADLGFWFGRRIGYKVLGNNLSDILSIEFSGGIPVVYGDSDSRQIVAEDPHHDGFNRYCFMKLKNDMDHEELFDAIYYGKLDDDILYKHADSLYDDVNQIYGWPA